MTAAPELTPRLAERAHQDGVEFILALFVDLIGKPCAKLVPSTAIEGLVAGGAGFAGFAAGPMGQSPADPDIAAMPDPSSYAVLPWKPEVAVVQCDPFVNGDPWPYGLEPNRPTLEAFVTYLTDQSLIAAPVPVDDLFVPTF